MVDRVLLSANIPVQDLTAHRAAHAHAVVDTGLSLRAFYIVVPGSDQQRRQFIVRRVILRQLSESRQPGLPAVLVHGAGGGPGRRRGGGAGGGGAERGGRRI